MNGHAGHESSHSKRRALIEQVKIVLLELRIKGIDADNATNQELFDALVTAEARRIHDAVADEQLANPDLRLASGVTKIGPGQFRWSRDWA